MTHVGRLSIWIVPLLLSVSRPAGCMPVSGDVNILLAGFNESVFSAQKTSDPVLIASPDPVSEAGDRPWVEPYIITLSRNYIPIFRFDRNATDNCFPDDKRQHVRLSGTCNPFSRTGYVFMNALTCGKYLVFQYNLWYGERKRCGSLRGMYNDSQYVQVWTTWTDGRVEKVRYGQGDGYYFRNVGFGVQLRGNRTVVYVGLHNHGMFHDECSESVLRIGSKRCSGACSSWDDYRRPGNDLDLDAGTLVLNKLAVDIDCHPGQCLAGHSFWRESANSSCYGVFN